MDQPVRNVTIVGGGTAGWIAAIMLQSRLSAHRGGPPVKVTLIESPTVKIIGVGEGTLPAFPKMISMLGIDEAEFVRRCNASFKYGVRFVGWNHTPDGVPYRFTHPFQFCGMLAGKNSLNYFMRFGPHGGAEPQDVADSLCVIPEAIRRKRAPRASRAAQGNPAKAGTDRTGLERYGYHFDAMRVADFLKEKSIARGVEYISDDVDDVVIGEGDIITHLRLREGGLRPVELVIDCTGFKGLLINKHLKEPFEPYASHLLCDRAVALQIPHRDPNSLESCTTATALSSGWVWRVPLFSRVGTGYVFSSAFRTDDQAIEEFTRHLGVDADKVEPRIVPMRVGRSRRTWVGNCIAVGLSSGFIEPLEATAIMTIQFAVKTIMGHFPNRSMQPGLRDRYNKTMATYHDSVRDFILMHYYFADRNEPFWIAARAPSTLTDSLGENLAVWRERLPADEDLPKGGIFNYMSYGACMISKGFYRDRRPSIEPAVSMAPWRNLSVGLGRAKSRLEALPSTYQFLERLAGDEVPAAQKEADWSIGDLSLVI